MFPPNVSHADQPGPAVYERCRSSLLRLRAARSTVSVPYRRPADGADVTWLPSERQPNQEPLVREFHQTAPSCPRANSISVEPNATAAGPDPAPPGSPGTSVQSVQLPGSP